MFYFKVIKCWSLKVIKSYLLYYVSTNQKHSLFMYSCTFMTSSLTHIPCQVFLDLLRIAGMADIWSFGMFWFLFFEFRKDHSYLHSEGPRKWRYLQNHFLTLEDSQAELNIGNITREVGRKQLHVLEACESDDKLLLYHYIWTQ